MLKKYYLMNGEKISSNEAKISVDDYGLMRGYAIFETIKFVNRKALNLNQHMDRLFGSISFIRINLDEIKRAEIISDINKIIKINELDEGLVKIIITKGSLENKNNKDLNPNIYITINKLYPIPRGPVKVVFYNELKYPILRFNPAIKSINYLGNMMAIEDANKEDAFEVVFYNNDKTITECAMRNIFFIKNNELITPSLNLGILPGTTRKIISELSNKVNLKYSERKILINDVNTMDEAFICSSVVGVLPCYWDKWESNYTITKQLQVLLEESLQK